MKLILDFDEPTELKITSTDDPDNHYLLSWMLTCKKCSLWYNTTELVWEREYENLHEVIGQTISALLWGMRQENRE